LLLRQLKRLLLLLDGLCDNTTCRLLNQVSVEPCLSIVERIAVE
jgi:hypothetical protein